MIFHTFRLGTEVLDLEQLEYGNGTVALMAKDEQGMRYATVSVNIPEELPSAGCFWLKDWSENEEIAAALLAQGVIALTGRVCRTGFVTAKEARLLL
jgi:hypothetical protein